MANPTVGKNWFQMAVLVILAIGVWAVWDKNSHEVGTAATQPAVVKARTLASGDDDLRNQVAELKRQREADRKTAEAKSTEQQRQLEAKDRASDTASAKFADMQRQIDDAKKATDAANRAAAETVVNAGANMWTSGLMSSLMPNPTRNQPGSTFVLAGTGFASNALASAVATKLVLGTGPGHLTIKDGATDDDGDQPSTSSTPKLSAEEKSRLERDIEETKKEVESWKTIIHRDRMFAKEGTMKVWEKTLSDFQKDLVRLKNQLARAQ